MGLNLRVFVLKLEETLRMKNSKCLTEIKRNDTEDSDQHSVMTELSDTLHQRQAAEECTETGSAACSTVGISTALSCHHSSTCLHHRIITVIIH